MTMTAREALDAAGDAAHDAIHDAIERMDLCAFVQGKVDEAILALRDSLPQESVQNDTAERPCETCNDDPAVCATVPGLRHCEKALRSESAPRMWNERAADRMAAAVDVMVRRNVLDARSLVADARLDYGQPFTNAEKVLEDNAPPIRADGGTANVPGAIKLAVFMHETYERLAPEYGYETRTDTRTFNASTPNGKLMIAVCGELRRYLCNGDDSEAGGKHG